MSMMSLTNMARSEGDPKVIQSGPSSVGASDTLAKALGWFSIGLGLAEIIAPARITRALGMEGNEALVRAYGMRELAAGVMTLSVEKEVGLWSRIAGDALDIATLASGMREDNPKRDNVAAALVMVLGVTLLDIAGATATASRHSRNRGEQRLYGDRSGFPKGLSTARGAAKDFAEKRRTQTRTPRGSVQSAA